MARTETGKSGRSFRVGGASVGRVQPSHAASGHDAPAPAPVRAGPQGGIAGRSGRALLLPKAPRAGIETLEARAETRGAFTVFPPPAVARIKLKRQNKVCYHEQDLESMQGKVCRAHAKPDAHVHPDPDRRT